MVQALAVFNSQAESKPSHNPVTQTVGQTAQKGTQMFKITGKKGFHIKFENGYTVSVQFGPGNYCDNYHMEIGRDEDKAGKNGSYNAECAVWSEDGELIDRWDGSTVSNRSTAEEVLALLNWAAAQQSVHPTNDGLTHADDESTPAVISG